MNDNGKFRGCADDMYAAFPITNAMRPDHPRAIASERIKDVANNIAAALNAGEIQGRELRAAFISQSLILMMLAEKVSDMEEELVARRRGVV